MSNIFAPLVRPYGTLPVLIESGPAVGHTEYMHMLVDDDGKLLCSNDAIHHYGAAIPFDINGRVVVSAADVVRWDQSIPFTASGAVAMLEAPEAAHWDQGLTFLDSGHIATGDEAPPATAPVWSMIPGTANYLYELEQYYDVSPYVSSGGDPITSYALIGAPDFFTIDSGTGVVTAGVGTPAASHVLTVEACNAIGCSTTTFPWALLTGNVPTWDPIPPQLHRQNELPQYLNVSPYVSSDSGPILSLTLVSPPPGISMSNGVITVAAGTAVSSYSLTVRATNGVGAGDTTFTWDVLEILTVPQWPIPIPGQSDVEVDLPETLDISAYPTSNSGALRNWLLISPPPGFEINQDGEVTAEIGTAVAVHNIVVQVENDEGASTSSFQWTISQELLPPQWTTILGRQDREDTLQQDYPVASYASSNDGPLSGWSLSPPVAGFTIDSSGVITAAEGIAPGVYPITVEVTNNTGTTSSAPFDWEITLFYLAPTWGTIPPKSDPENLLTPYDVSGYVTSNHGSLTGWALVTPPVGFSIDTFGVITADGPLSVGVYSLTVEVTNDTGTTQSTAFNWEVTLFYLVPQWSTIPAQVNRDDELPQYLNAALYVTTNSGLLTGWELVTPPAGFKIDASGVITAEVGVLETTHSITVRVSNDEGPAETSFNWTITDILTPPLWATVPGQNTSEQLLPDQLDLSDHVTSNDGLLTGWVLTTAPAGFDVDGGIVTADAGIAPGSYNLQAQVTNGSGTTSSNVFAWVIGAFYTVPQWTDIDDVDVGEDTLPAYKDTSTSVTSNHGALFSWSIRNPTIGFSVSTSGVVAAAEGTAPGDYFIQVQVSNSSGSSQMTDNGWEPWRFRIQTVYLPPQWSTIPPQSTEEQLLQVALDVKPYVTTNHGDLANWSLVNPPTGWDITQDGIITVSEGRPVGSNEIVVRVSNDSDSADSAAFTWDILEEPLPPQWDTIPPRQDRVNTLPQDYSVAPYVSTNSGPLTGWTLVSPPVGFMISGAGLITAEVGTTVAAHNLTVRVSNDEGSSDASFEWEIQEELLVPQWGTIPDQSDRINTLDQTLDASLYVTSNAGGLVLWRLASAPAGFSINPSSGVIKATAAAGVGDHSLRVGVTNSVGEALSNTFNWEILEELLPPQWSTIPDRSDDDDTLPQYYDVSGYVTSNSGPLDTWSLTSAPAGFLIDQSGVIKAETGATTGANSITVQVFNDEGSASKTFTWTIVQTNTSEYFHEFNASLGHWNFYRGSAAWGYDKDEDWHEVGVDAPVYVNCGWSGSAFTPNAAFEGIRIDFESTNIIPNNTNLTATGWDDLDMPRTTDTVSPRTTGANSYAYQTASATQQDVVMSGYHREIDTLSGGASMYLSPDGVTEHAFVPTSSLQRAISPLWTSQSTGSPMWLSDRTNGKMYANFLQIEAEDADGATGPIKTGSTPVTRDQDALFVANTDIGWGANDLTDGFCGQAKFRANIGWPGPSDWLQFYGIGDAEQDPTEDHFFAIWTERTTMKAAIFVSGSEAARVTIPYSMVREGDYDVRWRVDPNGGEVKLWVVGPGIDTNDTAAGSFNLVDNSYLVHKWGNWYTDTQTGSTSTTLKSLRIVKEVLSDAEIEAWA